MYEKEQAVAPVHTQLPQLLLLANHLTFLLKFLLNLHLLRIKIKDKRKPDFI